MLIDDTPWNIQVQPIGKVRIHDVRTVVAALKLAFPIEVVVNKSRALPKSAYYPARKRYRADRLLDFLRGDAGVKVLGITNVDISTTNGKVKDWGVFGLGSCPGRSCVVSTFRLRKRPQIDLNLRKVAIHEVGHTFGLTHCPNRSCVMADAEGTIKSLYAESDRFCPKCAAKLAAVTHRRSQN